MCKPVKDAPICESSTPATAIRADVVHPASAPITTCASTTSSAGQTAAVGINAGKTAITGEPTAPSLKPSSAVTARSSVRLKCRVLDRQRAEVDVYCPSRAKAASPAGYTVTSLDMEVPDVSVRESEATGAGVGSAGDHAGGRRD
jgi:hypothetical protein